MNVRLQLRQVTTVVKVRPSENAIVLLIKYSVLLIKYSIVAND